MHYGNVYTEVVVRDQCFLWERGAYTGTDFFNFHDLFTYMTTCIKTLKDREKINESMIGLFRVSWCLSSAMKPSKSTSSET